DEFELHARGLKSGIDSVQAPEAERANRDVDIHTLLGQPLQRGASDLHLAVGRPAILRISGELHSLAMEPLSAMDLRVLLFSIMTVRQSSQFELDREIDFALAFDKGERFTWHAH